LLRKVFSILCLLALFCYVGIIQAQPITAKSWLITNEDTNVVLDASNEDRIQPIASISKLIAAMVVLDAKQDLDELVPLSTKIKDALPSQLSRRTLLELALVNSNNRAAQTLCEQYPGGFGVCVYVMNLKLQSLNMVDSIVYEPTGLDKRNTSSAKQLVNLVKAAANYPFIVEADKKTSVEVIVKKRKLVYHNTNPLIGKKDFTISKTGWISASGGCIVTKLNNSIIIVLGSRNTHTRIYEVTYLYDIHRRRL
jgi:D-alanyl-D-alanine carboxypeptidase